jgi:lipopolysaccharide/colanic/teichoic acid biosynthesis glycosyltransferase
MSLVGPRPYMSHELDGEFGAHAAHITSVRPGITGLWQISGRSTLLPHQRIDLDRQYADSATFGADVRILLRTVIAVVVTRGAM